MVDSPVSDNNSENDSKKPRASVGSPADAGADTYYVLDSEHTDPARLKRERDLARKFKKTQAWQKVVNRGLCHYCEGKFKPSELTLDHVVPLARGGRSVPGNMVPACRPCNRAKKLDTPVEQLFRQLSEERSGQLEQERSDFEADSPDSQDSQDSQDD